jgi:hypothetical protein
MSEIHGRQVEHPCAWRAKDVGGKAGFSHPLTQAQCEAFSAVLDQVRGKPLLEIQRADVSDPILLELAATIRARILRGPGLIVLCGLDVDRFGEDGFQRIYWSLGQLVGAPAMQSERGDRLGYVRQERDNPYGRGYISNMELGFHADFHEVLSLASIQTADSGGESGFVSSPMLHNMLLQQQPELLPILYDGYFDGVHPYYKLPSPARYASAKLPYFSAVDGTISLTLGSHFEQLAAQERGEEIPEAVSGAVATVKTMANEPGVAARFVLERGEMVFWHNWTILHARSRFENRPGRERTLMRLWLHMDDHRPIAAPIAQRAHTVDQIHRKIGSL